MSTTCAGGFPNLLHAWPVLRAACARTRHRARHVARAAECRVCVTVLTQADVPAKATAGRTVTTSRCFRPRCCSITSRSHGCWATRSRPLAVVPGACRAMYDPLPAILTIEEAIEAGSFLTEPLRIVDGDTSVLESSPLRIEGELRIGGQEHFYLETQAALAWIDESGCVVGPLLDAASVGNAGGRRASARPASQSGDGRVPADGRGVRRQGGAGQPVCGHRRARRVEDATPRARPADSRARHGDDRQAPSVSRADTPQASRATAG